MRKKNGEKIKKITSCALAAMLIGGCTVQWNMTTASAEENIEKYTYEDFEYEFNYDNDITITGYIGTDENVLIPDEIDGISVTQIGEDAFYANNKIIAVRIPDSMEFIDNNAFQYCNKLTSVDIGNSKARIEKDSFRYCDKLTQIITNDNNERYSSVNGVLFTKSQDELVLFPQGKEYKIYSIPNSVMKIGQEAFDHCVSLTNIIIPSSVKSIGQGAFFWCNNLTNINISNGVKNIEHNAFAYCESLTNIVLPNSITEIGGNAFEECTSLVSINIPSGLKYISSFMFYNCSSLKSIKLPNSITEIHNNAFESCTNLTKINIPSSVKHIGDGVFSYCNEMRSITIPSSVTSIGEEVFKSNEDSKLVVKVYEGSYAHDYFSNKDINLEVIKVKELANNSIVNSSSIFLGEAIAIKAIATGGEGPYKYEYLCKKENEDSWSKLRDYSSTQVFRAIPKKAGNYEVKVNIKDARGNIASKTIMVTVSSNELTNKSTLSSESIVLGEAVTINALATGGYGDNKYEYLCRHENNKTWYKLRGYSSAQTFKATPKNEGNYEIKVNIKDASGNIVSKTMELTVRANDLSNDSIVSSSSIELGEAITIFGQATGGVGSYKYEYSTKNQADRSWFKLRNYSYTNNFGFIPQRVGNYEVKINVKDDSGKVVTKIINIEVR